MATIGDPARGVNAPAVRPLAGGETWSVSEVVCTAGPDDRPFEELHDGFSVSAVLEGCFTYRAARSASFLFPGALLLGNDRACFTCGHEHGSGDRCISFNVRDDALDEAAFPRSGGRAAFSQSVLPASSKLVPLFTRIESLRERATPLRAEETKVAVMETVAAALGAGVRAPAAPLSWEARRVVEVLSVIEERSDDALDLSGLAALAGLSRRHFLRVFRRLVGMTPYQYVLRTRIARAARRLATTKDPVMSIALDAGFGDLSTFNARFRATFGTTPSKYRRALA
jgi:AraC-like DNA-binding protein